MSTAYTYASMSSIDEDKIQIDKRLYHLVKCLEITDDCLKYKIKISKNMVKSLYFSFYLVYFKI